MAKSLTKPTKYKTFFWTPDAQCSFDDLEKILTAVPVLQKLHLDYRVPEIMDASAIQIEAVMKQEIDWKKRITNFIFRTFKIFDRNYATQELELFAILYNIEALISYLTLENLISIQIITLYDIF